MFSRRGRRRFPVRHPVVVDVGCQCWRTKKLSSLFSSSPSKPRTPNTPTTFSPSSSTTTTTSATPSEAMSSLHSVPESPNSGRRRRRRARESVAVAKDSASPYEDFKESMVQMIIEKEIYSWEDLRDLLHRLLALNSPCHHPLILRAFADVCRAMFSASSRGR